MKKYRIALFTVFALFFFAACDEDLLDVEESFSFTVEVDVITDESQFSATEVINLSDDVSLIDRYGNLIKEVSLDHIFVEITDYDGDIDVTLITGSLSVMNVDGSSPQLITNLGGLNLQDLVNNPTELELNAAGVEFLGELAKTPPHSFMLEYDVELDEEDVPIMFTVEFEFTATMVANPLN